MAEDVTLFTDDSVRVRRSRRRRARRCTSGRRSLDDDTLRRLATPELFDEIRGLSEMSFPTRRVQSVYLDWFHRNVAASLPPHVEVVVHALGCASTCSTATTAVSGSCSTAPMRIRCRSTSSCWRSGTSTPCPTTSAPSSPRSRATTLSGSCRADTPPSRTSRCSLPAPTCSSSASARRSPTSSRSSPRAGAVASSRDPTARSRTRPSGLEPVLHVGSRRGVPYRSKLAYRLLAPLAPLPHFLDDADDRRAAREPRTTRLLRDVLPVVAKEIGWAYYHELFVAHPERTTMQLGRVRSAIRPGADGAPSSTRSSPRPCPTAPTTSTSPRSTSRLPACAFASSDALHRYVADHVAADVARRTDTAYSADLARVHRHARDGRGTAPHRAPRDPTVAARGHQHVVAQLLHVLRQWSAAGSAAPAARARRRGARALRRRRHGRPSRRRDRQPSWPRARAIPTRSAARR